MTSEIFMHNSQCLITSVDTRDKHEPYFSLTSSPHLWKCRLEWKHIYNLQKIMGWSTWAVHTDFETVKTPPSLFFDYVWAATCLVCTQFLMFLTPTTDFSVLHIHWRSLLIFPVLPSFSPHQPLMIYSPVQFCSKCVSNGILNGFGSSCSSTLVPFWNYAQPYRLSHRHFVYNPSTLVLDCSIKHFLPARELLRLAFIINSNHAAPFETSVTVKNQISMKSQLLIVCYLLSLWGRAQCNIMRSYLYSFFLFSPSA